MEIASDESNLIDWNNSYSVGLDFIDEQHKKLFMCINNLHLAMRESKDNEILEKTIIALVDYVNLHFTVEEELFEKFNYEGKVEHIAQHKQYVDKIKSFQNEYANKKSLISFEIIDFLEDWILAHIMVEDKKYQKCFSEHGIK